MECLQRGGVLLSGLSDFESETARQRRHLSCVADLARAVKVSADMFLWDLAPYVLE